MYALCIVPVAPVRLSPDHASEMTSQLVFGEHCTVHGTAGNGFFQITCTHDGYNGFCMGNQLMMNVPEDEKIDGIFTGWINTIHDSAGHPMILPFGARWPRVFQGKFVVEPSNLQPTTSNLSEEKLKETAEKFINTPYLWGGRTVFGADCSGFVQMVMGVFGYALPRDASEQVASGRSQGRSDAACGDLPFFEVGGRIVHVGILLSNSRIIHAFGKVRIDRLDETGIWNEELNAYSHKLAEVRTLR
jgi:hypothetical protein